MSCGTLCYTIYGVRIQSDTELIGLDQCHDLHSPDITIRRCAPGETLPWLPELRPNPSSWSFRSRRLADGTVRVHAAEVCDLAIAPGADRIEWSSGSHDFLEASQTYLLGTGLSYCLVARGIEPIHAAVVAVNGKAVALMGDCGYGKSTLAASFIAAGHTLVTDDMLIMTRHGSRWLVEPGVARLKLFPDVRDALLPLLRGVKMNPFTDKEILYLKPQASAPIPLRAMYQLPHSRHQTSRIRTRILPARTAFFSLIRNTFNVVVSDPQRLRRQFEFARSVAESVPVRAITYPRNLAALPEVVRAITTEMGSL